MPAKLRPPRVRPGHVLRLFGPLVMASLLVGVPLAVSWPFHGGGPAGTGVPGDALEGAEVLPLADDGAAGATGPVINSIGMTMVWIRPGEFMMGSSPGEKDRDPDEVLHRVRITRPFYLSAFEVTVGQFRRFVEETGYVPGSEKTRPLSLYRAAESGRKEWAVTWRTPPFPQDDDHPVLCVTWDDAVQFCELLRPGLLRTVPPERSARADDRRAAGAAGGQLLPCVAVRAFRQPDRLPSRGGARRQRLSASAGLAVTWALLRPAMPAHLRAAFRRRAQ